MFPSPSTGAKKIVVGRRKQRSESSSKQSPNGRVVVKYPNKSNAQPIQEPQEPPLTADIDQMAILAELNFLKHRIEVLTQQLDTNPPTYQKAEEVPRLAADPRAIQLSKAYVRLEEKVRKLGALLDEHTAEILKLRNYALGLQSWRTNMEREFGRSAERFANMKYLTTKWGRIRKFIEAKSNEHITRNEIENIYERKTVVAEQRRLFQKDMATIRHLLKDAFDIETSGVHNMDRRYMDFLNE